MLYSDIQKRQFTTDYAQYSHFRKENAQILTYFKKFPLLAKELKISFINKWDFKTFWLHKISYFVEPELNIFAYLLIPKNKKGKLPGILALHQHNDEFKAGKSEVVGLVKNPEYMKVEAIPPDPNYETPRKSFAYGKELCEEGFVVLVPDFIAFEEYRDPNYSLDGSWNDVREYEEALSMKYLNYGSCLMIKHLHDAYVGISVLSSLNEVYSQKIGAIGHSLGGEVTTILSAFDSRIAAAVSSCGTLSYEDVEARNYLETSETIIPGFRGDNLDFDYFLNLIPPTRFLATAGASDKTVTGKHFLSKKRKNFIFVPFEGGHSFPEKIRRRAYDFLIDNLF